MKSLPHKSAAGLAAAARLSEVLERLGRPIAYRAGLAKLIGIEEAIFLQQLVYWTARATTEDGSVYKLAVDWESETSLTYRQQVRVRRGLVGRGLIRERYSRLQHRLYFQIVADAIDRLLLGGASNQTLPRPSDQTSDREMTKGQLALYETSSEDTTRGNQTPAKRADRLRNIDYAETPTETTQPSQNQNQPPLTPPASQVGRSNSFDFECAGGTVRVYVPFGRRLYRKGEEAHVNKACRISFPRSYCASCDRTLAWHRRKPELRRIDQTNDDGHEFQSDGLDRSNDGKLDAGALGAFFKKKGFRVEFMNSSDQPARTRDGRAAQRWMEVTATEISLLHVIPGCDGAGL
jgi:hypothetical protein